MKIIKSVIKAAGLCSLIGLTGCVSIFHAMSNDFSAERAVVAPVQENSYEPSTEIKVISYNIAHCRGPHDFYGDNARMDEPDRWDDLDMNMTINSAEQVYKCLDDVAEMIIRENADIVLLQEVDKKAVWSYDIDFTPYLAKKAGMGYYAYGSKYDFVWWPYEHERANGTWIDTVYFDIGNAVISRYPIISAENKGFGEQSFIGWIAGEERYLDTVIDIEGKNAEFISTHFGGGELESRVMVEEARENRMPLVFGGTLHLVTPAAIEANSTLSWCNANAMQILDDSGLFSIYMLDVNPNDISYYTSDTENLYWTADYVIPTNDIEIKDYHVVDAELSDHKPVAATLVINDAH